MLKKTMTYENWNGNTITEDFYFNLTRSEMLEIEYGMGPGKSLTESIQTLINEKNTGVIIQTIKDILLKSYGEKSPDGKRFIKNDNLREAFEQNPVFDMIYMDLVSDAEAAADFINGIIPTSVSNELGDDPKNTLLEKMREFEQDTIDKANTEK